MQVGIAQPLIFEGLTARDQRLFALMEGAGVSSLAGLSPAGVAALDALVRARVARPAERAENRGTARQSTVAIHGLGSPGRALAECLARLGFALELCDETPLIRESRAHVASPRGAFTCAAAAADSVRQSVPGATVRLTQSAPDLAVVFGVGACDPAVTVPLMASDIPHVLITCDEQGAWVGPLVVPGETACAACVGLHHTDKDPSWPHMSLQLGQRRRPALTADAVAGVTALASAAVRAHTEPMHDAEWIRSFAWRVTAALPAFREPAPAHPDCGCGAFLAPPGAATDELAVRRARFALQPAAIPPHTW